MPTSLEFEDKLVENAVEKACRELKISKEKLKYDVISYGSSGIFGLVGTKKARIRVTLPDSYKHRPKAEGVEGIGAREAERIAQEEIRETVSSLVEEAFEGSGKHQEEDFETAVEIESHPAQESEPPKTSEIPSAPDFEPDSEPASEPDSEPHSVQASEKVAEAESPAKREKRSKSSGKSRRKPSRSKRKSNKGATESGTESGTEIVNGGENAGREPLPSSDADQDLTTEPPGPDVREVQEDLRTGTGEDSGFEAVFEAEAIPADDREASGGEDPRDPAIEQGEAVLQRVIDFITTGAAISVNREKERVLYQVNGGETGVLIGRRGQTLEAIQYLVEKIVNKHADERIRVQVDIEGYLDGRMNRLKNLANRLSEKAKRTGKPVTIGQLNSHDRRIVHLSLKDDSGVRTQSMGDGFYRKLVIFPKKKGSGSKKK